MRTRQKRVATDTWRSLGCRTNLVIEHELMRKLKIYMCLGGVDIFHRSINMFLYFVFTKLGALNAYKGFVIKLLKQSNETDKEGI